ncbi:MAG: leucine-rich repeat protein [Oscillospiraceae bacterium]|nr:leucine-rich repeat protein [Oscillospiraceae bacterium]
MKQRKCVLSLTAAVLSALMMPVSMLSAAAAETDQPKYDSDFYALDDDRLIKTDLDNYAETLAKFGIENCNFDGKNTDAEPNDFYTLESEVNKLLRENNYGDIVADANTTRYDVNKDSHITPEDYCVLLKYVQRDYEFEIISGDELYAKITKYNGTGASEIEVPREVFFKGRIFPVMEIGNRAFAGHTELKSIKFRNYVQPDWHIKNSTSVQIPTAGKVTASTCLRLDSQVFDGCSNLKTLTLPQHTVINDVSVFNAVPAIRNKYVKPENGILYFRDPDVNNNTVIAFYVESSLYDTAKAAHSVSFAEDTTSINLTMTWALPYDDIYNVDIPDSVTFIQDSAFDQFKKLRTINNETFRSNTPEIQKLTRRYLSAFDSTLYTTEETQRIISELERQIKAECDPETDEIAAAVLAGKLIAERAEYSDYYSLNRKNNDKPAAPDNLWHFSGGYELYQNEEYYYNDLLRNTTYSATAVYMLKDEEHDAYTDCVGFALASSLLLDKLGIENYYCGAPQHALNVVRANGYWFSYDMSGNSQADPDDLNARNLLTGIGGNMCVSNNNKFEMFAQSADKQLTEKDIEAPILQPADHFAPLLLLKMEKQCSDQSRAILSKENVHCTFLN